jgi:hypothetical protein
MNIQNICFCLLQGGGRWFKSSIAHNETQSFAGKNTEQKRGRSTNKNYKPPLMQADGASLEMIGVSVTLPTGRSGTITAGLGRATGKLRRKIGIASARILTPVDPGGISL